MPKQKCQIIKCIDGHPDAVVSVNENIGDASYRVMICQACADCLEVKDGGDLPEPDVTASLLKHHAKEIQYDHDHPKAKRRPEKAFRP